MECTHCTQRQYGSAKGNGESLAAMRCDARSKVDGIATLCVREKDCAVCAKGSFQKGEEEEEGEHSPHHWGTSRGRQEDLKPICLKW